MASTMEELERQVRQRALATATPEELLRLVRPEERVKGLSNDELLRVLTPEQIAALAKASGAEGMVLGQALDIAAETTATPLSLDEITHLQAGKTGALISFAAEAGAILAGADRSALAAYATALGLAFQIADDILDVTGDAGKAGKKLRKDAYAGKATFVSLLGLDGARKRAHDLVEEAEAALSPYGNAADSLRQAARFVIARDM